MCVSESSPEPEMCRCFGRKVNTLCVGVSDVLMRHGWFTGRASKKQALQVKGGEGKRGAKPLIRQKGRVLKASSQQSLMGEKPMPFRARHSCILGRISSLEVRGCGFCVGVVLLIHSSSFRPAAEPPNYHRQQQQEVLVITYSVSKGICRTSLVGTRTYHVRTRG